MKRVFLDKPNNLMDNIFVFVRKKGVNKMNSSKNNKLKCKNTGVLIKRSSRIICSYNMLRAHTFRARRKSYVHVTRTVTNVHVVFSGLSIYIHSKRRTYPHIHDFAVVQQECLISVKGSPTCICTRISRWDHAETC